MPIMRSPLPKVNDYPALLDEMWQLHLAPRSNDAPTVISTFAGGGGSSLGYSMAGFRELLAVEWDDNAVETFKLNFPDVPVYHGDIAKLSVAECLRLADVAPGELDILDGSPLCQGFSTAGKRVMDDPRNQLFREFVRLLRGLRPKVFVMENVSGMVKGKMKLVFADILRELKASGYQVSARLLNAMYFRVPQSRQRVIFVGVRDDLGIEASHPKAEWRAVTVREAIDHLPIGVSGKHQPQVLSAWVRSKSGQSFAKTDRFVGSFQSVRLDPNKPSATQIKSHLNWHYKVARLLSREEAGLLSSFPTKWIFVGSQSDYKQRIGNSVPPLFMEAIARYIRTYILDMIPDTTPHLITAEQEDV